MGTGSKAMKPCRPGFGRAYHIDWNAGLDRWDVIDDEGRAHGHGHDLSHATDLAIQQAHNDHSAGHDVIVCVQQDDGTYTMAWASR